MSDADEIVYEVQLHERAEMQCDQAFLNLLGRVGADYAIPEFPGPLALAVDEEATKLYQEEVRRELYYGPGRRRTSGLTYRILFTIKPPFDGGNPHTILILRVLHGASSLTGGGDTGDDES